MICSSVPVKNCRDGAAVGTAERRGSAGAGANDGGGAELPVAPLWNGEVPGAGAPGAAADMAGSLKTIGGGGGAAGAGAGATPGGAMTAPSGTLDHDSGREGAAPGVAGAADDPLTGLISSLPTLIAPVPAAPAAIVGSAPDGLRGLGVLPFKKSSTASRACEADWYLLPGS